MKTQRLVSRVHRRPSTRKNLREPLQEGLLRMVLDFAPIGILGVNAKGRIVFANTHVERIFGYAQGELLGVGVETLIPEKFRAGHVGRRASYARHPRTCPMGAGRDLRGRRKDGSEFPVEVGLSTFESAEGALVISIIEDISQRKNLEESLRQHQEQLEQLVQHRTAELNRANEVLVQQVDENQKTLQELRTSQQRLALYVMQTPLAAIECDVDLKVTEWNLAAEKIFGYSRQEALGRNINLIFPKNAWEHAARTARDLLEGRGDAFQSHEEENFTKTGKTILCEWYCSPVVDKGAQIVAIACLVNDITEHKKLEEQFRQTQKMEAIGVLAGGGAHDFNNLLNVILGHSAIALESIPVDNPQHKRIAEIKKAAQRAASVTRQLLAFSRKQILEPRAVNLNDILLDMDELLRHILGEDIELVTKTDAALELVKVDPGQMEQVLMNLAVNARDAMPGGGKLTLEAANAILDDEFIQSQVPGTPGEYVMLAVSDTGCGMNKATQERVFEPFFTTKEPGKGTGLGLSTVHGIVKQSGGYIRMYSELGRGTTFKIYLPRFQGKIQGLPADEPILEEAVVTETILIVEDDAALRGLAREILTGKGYTVLLAGDGAEALAIVERHPGPIDLVISDVVLPVMTGPTLVKKLTGLRPQMKVIFVSGYTDDAIGSGGLLNPEIEFLQKPYTPAELVRKVRSVIHKGTSRQESFQSER